MRNVWLAVTVIGLVACGGGGGSGSGSDGGGAGSDGGGGCTHADDCDDGQVCLPQSGGCAGGVSCSGHGECGNGGICNDGTCEPNSTGGPCDDAMQCPAGEICEGGFCGCAGIAFHADLVPPNILISLDRSGSMVTNTVPGDDPPSEPTRWTVAKQAITALLADHGDQIRFGLKLWPGSNLDCDAGGSCSPGVVRVDPDVDTAGDINSDLAAASTCSYGTPITGSLTSLMGDDRLLDTERANFIILVTDGQQQSCTGNPVDAVADLRGQTPSVKTFVVGFSGDVDEGQLEDMAIAAGTDRPGPIKYYQADDEAALLEAFDDIAGAALSCTYSLDGTPPDDELYVYFDGEPVAPGADGWTYDAGSNTITFSGAACDALQGGEVTDLAVVYGCPGSPVE